MRQKFWEDRSKIRFSSLARPPTGSTEEPFTAPSPAAIALHERFWTVGPSSWETVRSIPLRCLASMTTALRVPGGRFQQRRTPGSTMNFVRTMWLIPFT